MLTKTPSQSDDELAQRSHYPRQFGRYALLERLGTGGMADVFRAVTIGSEGFRRVVVIKRVRSTLAGSPEFLSLFGDEAKISALLDHPNIVQVYDFGRIGAAPFLAMEYVQGKDLRVVLRALADTGRRMRPSLAALVCQQVAQALHYAHTLRDRDERPFHIVHRDINPTNLMLARSGMVKVLDFGIAKASVHAGKAQTQQPMIKGKLSYLSPEQALCQPLDARSDLFSLGATFWEMLTGKRLFRGTSEFERIHNVVEAPIVAPSSLAPGVAPELDAIVMRALERDVERRYQSAQEMSDDLERFLQAEPAGNRAIQDVLEQLFGKASMSSGERLPLGGGSKSGGRDSGWASRRTPSGPLRAPARRAGGKRRGGLRRTVPMAWAAALLAIVAVFVAITSSFISSMFRDGRDPVVHAATNAGVGVGDVQIEIESEPPGALVRGNRGPLGTTPFKLTLPSSSAIERLSLELPGYEREIYDVRPTKSSFVFVELQPASARREAETR